MKPRRENEGGDMLGEGERESDKKVKRGRKGIPAMRG